MYNEKNNNNATCNDYNEYHRSKDMEERLVNKEKTAETAAHAMPSVEMVKIIHREKKEMVRVVDKSVNAEEHNSQEQQPEPVYAQSNKIEVNIKPAENNVSLSADALSYGPSNCITAAVPPQMYGVNNLACVGDTKNHIHKPYISVLYDDAAIMRRYRLPMGPYHCRKSEQWQCLLYKHDTAICNFIVSIDKITYDGEKYKYVCSVYLNNREYTVKCDVANFRQLKWLDDIPRTMIWARNLLQEYLNVLAMNNDIMEEYIDAIPGWRVVDGKRLYITPDGVIGHPEMLIQSSVGQHFKNIRSKERGDIWKFQEMAAVTKQNPAAQLILLYDMMSFCYTLFKDAGFVPKFLLFLHGARGTKKTSVALALTQIENKTAAEYTVKSTAAGLESGFNVYKDSVMLIDDLHPAVDKAEERIMKANLDLITRLFGDANGKHRDLSFAREKREQYTTAGGCIVTGEYISGYESSLSRTLFLPLGQDDVDTMVLTDIQSDPGRLSLFMVRFIEYLSADTDKIVEYIKQTCGKYRAEREHCHSNARYAEYRAQLLVSAEIFYKMFCVDAGYMTIDEAYQILRQCMTAIDIVIDKNNQQLKAQSPATVLCKALLSGINSSIVNVIQFGQPLNYDNIVIDGDSKLYMTKETVLLLYKHYMQSNGIAHDSQNTSELLNILKSINAIKVINKNGRTRRTHKLEGYANKRFVHIYKQALIDQINA